MLLSERFERYYYISLYVLLYYYPFFKRRQMSHVQFICWEYVLIDCIIIWHYKNKLVINFIWQYKHFQFRNQAIQAKIVQNWLHLCCWRMLETKCVGDKFQMLVTDLIHWENHQHNEKSRQHNDSATNISNQSPS